MGDILLLGAAIQVKLHADVVFFDEQLANSFEIAVENNLAIQFAGAGDVNIATIDDNVSCVKTGILHGLYHGFQINIAVINNEIAQNFS